MIYGPETSMVKTNESILQIVKFVDDPIFEFMDLFGEFEIRMIHFIIRKGDCILRGTHWVMIPG